MKNFETWAEKPELGGLIRGRLLGGGACLDAQWEGRLRPGTLSAPCAEFRGAIENRNEALTRIRMWANGEILC